LGRLRPAALAAAFGALACALSSAPGAHAAAAPKEELKELRGRIEALQKELAAAEGSRTEATDALRESERAISEAKRALRELAGEQRTASERLREAQGRAGNVRGDIAVQQQRLAALLHRQYLAGDPGALRLLLAGEDPGATARRLHYLSYVSRAQADLIRQLRESLSELAAVTREQEERAAELAALERQQQEESRRLEQEGRARRAVLTKLSRQIEAQRREISTLQRDEARLTRLVERLARVLTQPAPRSRPPPGPRNERLPDPGTDGGPFGQLKGRLALPVRGELRHRYGSPRADGGVSWKGVFIAAGNGTEVRAVAEGRVVYADWLRGFGNLIILDHGGGYMSLYGNNETLHKRVGDPARAGEPIAAVGATGGSPDSGLYFELRHQGRPFDPMTWVALK